MVWGLDRYDDKMFGMYTTFPKNPEAKDIGHTKNQIETLSGSVFVTSIIAIGTTFKIKF